MLLLQRIIVEGTNGTPQTTKEENDEASRRRGPRKISGWTDVHLPISDPGGAHEPYFIFLGPEEGAVTKLDQIEFKGEGVMGGGGLSTTH